jgi:hypothetical protein
MNIEKLNNQLGNYINLFNSYNSGLTSDGASFAKICDAGSVTLYDAEGLRVAWQAFGTLAERATEAFGVLDSMHHWLKIPSTKRNAVQIRFNKTYNKISVGFDCMTQCMVFNHTLNLDFTTWGQVETIVHSCLEEFAKSWLQTPKASFYHDAKQIVGA